MTSFTQEGDGCYLQCHGLKRWADDRTSILKLGVSMCWLWLQLVIRYVCLLWVEEMWRCKETDLAPTRDRKGLLSLSLAWVVFTPLSRMIPAWNHSKLNYTSGHKREQSNHPNTGQFDICPCKTRAWRLIQQHVGWTRIMTLCSKALNEYEKQENKLLNLPYASDPLFCIQ